MIINHNMASLNTYRQMSINEKNTSNSLEKLSSGLRINKAGDDAAGLAISEKMRGQIRGLDQASSNAQDGISLLQTAEGALNETHSILQRMRELSVQSGNDTATADDRKQIQSEVDQLSKEITRIANTTEFNTKKLLNGAIETGNTGELTFQIGANTNQNMSISIGAMDAQSLGVARTATKATVATNTSGVASAEGDIGINADDKLAEGTYTVTVGTVAAGAFSETQSTGATATVAQLTTGATAADSLVSGKATKDTNITLTYDSGAVADGATIAAADAGAAGTDTLAFDFGTAAGAGANGVTIKIDHTGKAGAVGAAWDSASNTITIQLSNDTQTNNVDDNIQSAIRALGTAGVVTKTDSSTLNLSAMTVTGLGDYNTGTGVAYNAGNMSAADVTFTAAAGGVTGVSAGWTASNAGALNGPISSATNAINGLNINMTKITGSATDGETITIKGYKDDTNNVQLFSTGTTPAVIGDAVTIDKSNGGTYTIGDTTTGKMSVTFAPNTSAAGNATVTIDKSASTATTFSNGQVSAEADAKGGIDVSTQGAANSAITVIDNAINKVSDQRSKLGAVENRLDHTISNLGTSSENLTAAESRIRDVDMAKEMMEFTKNNILNQAAQAMLAQANQQPQGVLQLLR